jgi:glycosyltransferase involved in cell wall biosynthesis
MNKNRMSDLIIIYSPTPVGGLAEHIHYQAEALSKKNKKILMLASPSFLECKQVSYPIEYCLLDMPAERNNRLINKVKSFIMFILNQYILSWYVLWRRPALVLLSSYVEYFSPFWILPHLLLSKFFGVKYAANLHDPIRNFILGPQWWHDFSVNLSYLPLSYVLVHQRLEQSSSVPKHIKIAEVPVGVYSVDTSHISNKETMRKNWKAPNHCKVFLSFGFVRDNKNIDLFMQAMVGFPDVFLVIAGKVASEQQKPLSFYQDLSQKLDITDRIYFFNDFVPNDLIASYFLAADFVLLCYSSSFFSQSGVLNIAAGVKKAVLASSNSSPLKDCVIKYGLGVFVEPDNIPALEYGIDKLLTNKLPSPKWSDYCNYASWDTNVSQLLALTDINE